MKGYLQRLVLGGMKPNDSIQPMVGSLFSAFKYGKDDGTQIIGNSGTGSLPGEKEGKQTYVPLISGHPADTTNDHSSDRFSDDRSFDDRFYDGSDSIAESSAHGYLQRLALRAMKPSEAIQPMLEPLFATVKSQRDDPALPSAPDPVLDSVPTFEDLSHTPEPEHPNVLDGSRTILEEIALPRLPITGTQDSSKETKTTVEPAMLGTTQQQELVYKSSPRMKEARTDSKSSQTVKELEVEGFPRQSKLHEVLEHIYSPMLQARVGGTSGDGVEKNEKDSLRRSALGERATDEIQIHIGRIEVTAIAAAPVREAAKPRPKSLSLDEYLKQRNGRAM